MIAINQIRSVIICKPVFILTEESPLCSYSHKFFTVARELALVDCVPSPC